MATVTDVEVANASFPTVRQDLNDILEAIATNFSADAEPTTTYANQWWYETDTNKLYIRNEDNDAWIHVLTLDQTTDAVSSVEGVSADAISEGNSSVEVIDTGTGYIQINVDGAEIARFDANGRLGIGTTSPDGLLTIDTSTNTNADTMYILRGSGNSLPASIDTQTALLVQNRSDTFSTNISIIADDAGASTVNFGDQSDENAGGINYLHDVNAMRFNTNGNTERMRIDSSGNLLVGTTDSSLVQHSDSGAKLASDGGQFQLARNGGGGVLMINRSDNDNVTRDVVVFFRNADNCGTITASNTTTNYNTSSDYRLKENWVPMSDSITRVKELNPVNFAWKSTGLRVDGFLAHEAQTIVPESVTGEKDEMQMQEYQVSPALGEIFVPATDDADEQIISSDVERPETLEEGQEWRETTPAVMGEREVPKYQGIDQAKLVPLLTGALKEAIARIETLESEVAALKA